jgi:hypothetical protein
LLRDHVASATAAVIARRAAILLLAATAILAAAQPAAASTQTFLPTADAHVSESAPKVNYGTASSLKLDGSPSVAGFVRFAPQVDGSVSKATLRFYTNKESGTGFEVRTVANSSWNERTITNANAPTVSSSVLGRSGGFGRSAWVSVDVTAAVSRSGAVTFALRTPSPTDFLLASREAGKLRAAQLVVDTGAPAPSPAPPPPPPPPPPADAVRPYDPASPWNTPIGPNPVLDPQSNTYINAIADNNLPLTSDVDQYTIPVYRFNASTPLRTVKLSGYFSAYDAGDNSRKSPGFAPTVSGIPVPENALQSSGTDGQIVIWNPETGVEYSFWQFKRDASGAYTATNGYRYHTTAGYYGRFADGRSGRGAGTPYFAGLVRKWEIDRGRIDHALAFAYDAPSGAFRYPASKSDGLGDIHSVDPPEGARIQLDPSLTDADLTKLGLSPAARTIAKALQTYGMYVIDNSRSSKVYLEDRMTAGWDATIDRHLVSKLPWNAFRVVAAPPAP